MHVEKQKRVGLKFKVLLIKRSFIYRAGRKMQNKSKTLKTLLKNDSLTSSVSRGVFVWCIRLVSRQFVGKK